MDEGWLFFGILIKLQHCQLKIDTFRVIYDDGWTAMMAKDSKTAKLFHVASVEGSPLTGAKKSAMEIALKLLMEWNSVKVILIAEYSTDDDYLAL